MPTTIHCIRHAQGFHNVGVGFYDLPDPKLTPLGEEQCLALREKRFREQSHISLIASSPLSRALQSAYLVFEPSLNSKGSPKTILALPDAQETSDDPCDIGSDVEILQATCQENHWPVDLSLVKEGWNNKKIGGHYSPAGRAIANRARDARIFLRKQARNLAVSGDSDVHIVLVAHGGFMHFFSEDWENASKYPATGWVNCETRAYTFEHGVDNDNDADAHVVETMESRRERGLDYPMIPKEKQGELYDLAMQAWEDQGLQNPSKIETEGEDAEVYERAARTSQAENADVKV